MDYSSLYALNLAYFQIILHSVIRVIFLSQRSPWVIFKLRILQWLLSLARRNCNLLHGLSNTFQPGPWPLPHIITMLVISYNSVITAILFKQFRSTWNPLSLSLCMCSFFCLSWFALSTLLLMLSICLFFRHHSFFLKCWTDPFLLPLLPLPKVQASVSAPMDWVPSL